MRQMPTLHMPLTQGFDDCEFLDDDDDDGEVEKSHHSNPHTPFQNGAANYCDDLRTHDNSMEIEEEEEERGEGDEKECTMAERSSG